MLDKVSLVSNPIIDQALMVIRNKKSDLESFRMASSQVVLALIMEASKSFSQKETVIETPVEETKGKVLKNDIVIVATIRAGQLMIEPTLSLIPSAKIGYIVVKQEEITGIARQYYASIGSCDNSDVLVLDPMLATGEASVLAVKHIMQQNPSSVTMVCMIAAPEGIKKMQTEFPQVNIVTAAIDNNLNDKKFICPGLGDFGDIFNGTI